MRSMLSTAFVLAAALIVEVLWAGGVAATSPSAFHAVLIKDFKYQPSILAVKLGDTIEWKNADIVPHTVTAVDKSFNSGAISPGHSWKFIVRTAGSVNYFCTLHPNMRAKLIVQ
ncbi:MAG TPA: cupredoxin family copper-binding protein [Terriglobales bacterium]|nr:cupredoxin family copper-binding protein [Terriglobales bacterium]